MLKFTDDAKLPNHSLVKTKKCGRQGGPGARWVDEPQERADSRSGLANGTLIKRRRIEQEIQRFEYASSPLAGAPLTVDDDICTINSRCAMQR